MITIEHILCPTDLSPKSDEALRYAMALGRAYKAKLLICYCQAHDLVADPEAELHAGEDSLFQLAESRLEKAMPPEIHRECKIYTDVQQGKPFHVVLEYAKDNYIDLICMGVRGESAGLKAMIGSNTDRVLRRAPCPVLIARPHLRSAASF